MLSVSDTDVERSMVSVNVRGSLGLSLNLSAFGKQVVGPALP